MSTAEVGATSQGNCRILYLTFIPAAAEANGMQPRQLFGQAFFRNKFFLLGYIKQYPSNSPENPGWALAEPPNLQDIGPMFRGRGFPN